LVGADLVLVAIAISNDIATDHCVIGASSVHSPSERDEKKDALPEVEIRALTTPERERILAEVGKVFRDRISHTGQSAAVTRQLKGTLESLTQLFKNIASQSPTHCAEMAATLIDLAVIGGVRLKLIDKKREKSLVANMRQALLEMVPKQATAASLLQVAATVVHSQITGTILHANTASLVAVVRSVKPAVDGPIYDILSELSSLVVTPTAAASSGSDADRSASSTAVPSGTVSASSSTDLAALATQLSSLLGGKRSATTKGPKQKE